MDFPQGSGTGCFHVGYVGLISRWCMWVRSLVCSGVMTAKEE